MNRKRLRLALIKLLSDPDARVEEYSIEYEIKSNLDAVPLDSFVAKSKTGRMFVKMTLFKKLDNA